MKKTLLALAFVGALTVSCKEKTEEKMDEAVEAVGTEMTETIDSTAAAAGEAIDSTAAAGAAKVEEAAKEVKEEVKH